MSGWVTGRPRSSTTVSSATSAERSRSSMGSGRAPTTREVYPARLAGYALLRPGDGAGRRQRQPGLHARRDLLGRHGPAEIEALAQRAALLDQEQPLILGLDPLGQRHHADAVGELHHGPDH